MMTRQAKESCFPLRRRSLKSEAQKLPTPSDSELPWEGLVYSFELRTHRPPQPLAAHLSLNYRFSKQLKHLVDRK